MTKHFLRSSRIAALVLPMFGLMFGLSMQATATEFPLEPLVHPANGGSTADTFYALFANRCGSPTLDPRQVPQITRGPSDEDSGNAGFVEEIDIHYFLVAPDGDVCPAVVLPDTLTPVSLGHLQEGVTAISHTFSIRDADGEAYRDVALTVLDSVVVGDTPNAAVSGTWFDPTTPGVGVSLSLAPDAGHNEPTAVLFLATLSREGESLWLTGSGKFVDATLQVALTRSSAGAQGDIDTAPAGTATFDYLGCGETRLAVEGVDVRFPVAEATLRQLTHTFGLPPCEPPTTRPFGA